MSDSDKSVAALERETATTEELRAKVVEYEAQIVEIADLVARVRHEINNPLAGILGQAQLMLREDLSERAMKRAVTIEELAVRLRDVVAQLRQIQRPVQSMTEDQG